MVTIDYISLFNVPALLLLGIVTSRQDFKDGKIRNRWIVISVLYSFLTLGLVALLLRLGGGGINPYYVKTFFLNLLFSLGFGIFVWLCKLWSAGDAKLFVAYAALIPISAYKWQASALFPSYVLLINTFTPIFVFLLFRMLFRLKPSVVWEELKNSFAPKTVLSFGLFIFGFSLIGNLFTLLAGIKLNPFAFTVMLVGLMIFFTNAVKVDLMKVSIVFSVIRLVLDFKLVMTVGFWLLLALQILMFMLLRYFVLNLGARAFSRQIYVEDLKPGMCLAYDVVEEEGEMKNRKTTTYSYLQSMFDAFRKTKSVVSDYSCLSSEDVEKLKKSHSEGKLKDHIIMVYDKLSFAVFMFAGALVTLIVQGDLIAAIRVAVERFI